MEGLDGSGTTTQLKLFGSLAKRKRTGIFLLFYLGTYPGPVGSLLRLALSRRLQQLDEKTMALLYAADRTDHIYKEGIGGQEPGLLQKLKNGSHVISDRYLLSSLAYQGRELGLEATYALNAFAIQPDITIFLDIPPQEAAARLKAGRSYQELYESLPEQQKIREQYFKAIDFLRKKGQQVRVLSVSESPGKSETLY